MRDEIEGTLRGEAARSCEVDEVMNRRRKVSREESKKNSGGGALKTVASRKILSQ